ncbi:MAG: Hsp20/alpha crystallin family protein [Proteobacteria bacterium]|nr:Hsp20/alpha crystallin family protein [Pseudomonadota bacterium]
MAKYDDNPWDRLEALAQGMDRIAEGLSGRMESRAGRHLRQPLSNVLETADGLTIEVELPGVRQQDVAVELVGRKLSVFGETRLNNDVEGGVYNVMERCPGSFGREFVLPGELAADHVSAVFADGLLTITVPKQVRDRKRTVRIEISD